jgi:hypothetical protein
VIQSTEKSGTIRITAVSANLKEAALQVISNKPNNTANTVEGLKQE